MRITTTIKLSESLELEVEGIYTPEEPMVWTLPNGDPGYPGCASEFDINDIKIIKGDLVELIDILDTHQWKEVQKVRENPDKYTTTENIWEYLTELVIKKIEKNDGLQERK